MVVVIFGILYLVLQNLLKGSRYGGYCECKTTVFYILWITIETLFYTFAKNVVAWKAKNAKIYIFSVFQNFQPKVAKKKRKIIQYEIVLIFYDAFKHPPYISDDFYQITVFKEWQNLIMHSAFSIQKKLFFVIGNGTFVILHSLFFSLLFA